jgi:thioredoxin-like negative regulator of GroEL
MSLDSALDEVATACAGSVKVAWVNADDHPDLSMWYGIQSIPTLLYFVDGRLRARVVGTASKAAILSLFKPFTETP